MGEGKNNAEDDCKCWSIDGHIQDAKEMVRGYKIEGGGGNGNKNLARYPRVTNWTDNIAVTVSYNSHEKKGR